MGDVDILSTVTKTHALGITEVREDISANGGKREEVMTKNGQEFVTMGFLNCELRFFRVPW